VKRNLIDLLGLILLATSMAVTAQTYVYGDFNYSTDRSVITITDYTGSGGAVIIPDAIDGLPVTSIGIGAFAASSGLTNVTIPDSVTNIGYHAFYFCTDLTSITIPGNVTGIGEDAFYQCFSLTAIAVEAVNAFYSSVDGVLFDKDRTTLIQCPSGKVGSYPIPSSVTHIGTNAFYRCASLTNVTIPNGVIHIGDSAFALSGLTGVFIPNSVTHIGSTAFGGCFGLTSVTIPDHVTSISDSAFMNCQWLTSVTIPDGVTSIGNGAFRWCGSLTSVTIPNCVRTIGTYAFHSCTSLTRVTVGHAVTTIGDYAFSDCNFLTSVFFKGDAPAAAWTAFNFTYFAWVYYLPGTDGWRSTFAGCPTTLWVLPSPVILSRGSAFGVQTNGFGFTVSWATNLAVVVESSTTLASDLWVPLQTNTLTGGRFYFSDPDWTSHPARFYRVRSP
jgi:hypothetical protein